MIRDAALSYAKPFDYPSSMGESHPQARRVSTGRSDAFYA